jgi:hypothetical protein
MKRKTVKNFEEDAIDGRQMETILQQHVWIIS